MRTNAHVVIIGSGIIGLSCAYWLSKFGVEDIVVIDRHKDIAQGSTKNCAGVITHNFADKTLVNLAIESVKLFRDIPCGMVFNGQLFLYSDLDSIEQAKKDLEMQRSLHIAVDELEQRDIAGLIPTAALEDISYGLMYKGDATADVKKVIDLFKAECIANDVEFITDTAVKHTYSKDGKVEEVSTSRGHIKTNIVINAAGAHAGVIGHLAGVDVPVLPLRMHGVTTTPVSAISSRIPIVCDTKDSIKIIPHKEGFYLLQQYHHEDFGFFTGVEENFIYDMLDNAEKRFPAFSSARIKDKFSMYHDMTPDRKPIIGATRLKGFYCACGFSGSSFTFAPVVGMIIADLIVHPKSRHDITGLGIDRFSRKPRPKPYSAPL